ncbi:hypothetical protein D9756_007165 [Leucocoprinus leucothites]|uniref:Cytochrome P450 n=1 Tax=Leucocoprinus leucothites TaxID=201217 RepID=A0A8H5D7F4_9AGAR|nr:hypothetical protein D9756_007165 [Leucoagaricus leucothites]
MCLRFVPLSGSLEDEPRFDFHSFGAKGLIVELNGFRCHAERPFPVPALPTMSLPPGPNFIARSLIDFLLPCIPIYPTLALANTHLLDLSLPKGALVVSTLVLRLGYILSQPWVDEYKNSKAARAHGAILVPHVKENHFKLVKALLHDLANGYPCDTLGKLSEKYQSPTYRLSIGLDEVYITIEPDHIKSMLATEFDAFEKGWFHRSITRPFFTRDRVTDFDNFERHTQEALKRAKARLAKGYPIDFQDMVDGQTQDLVARFTLDSATEFLFNHDFHSLDAPLPYPAQSSSKSQKDYPQSNADHPSNLFVEALVTSQEIIARRGTIGGIWPLLEFWGDTVVPHRKTLDHFVQPFLEKGLREKETRAADSEEYKGALLDYLHPDIEQRLRQEILEKVGSERSPTIEDIRELRYLRAFLNALEFDPDRFLDERLHKYLVPNPFIFCPFNAGPRICPGQQFAYNEASFFLIRLLQQFTSFSLDENARTLDGTPKPEWAGLAGPQGRDRIRFKNTLTMYVRGGLWVRMKEVAA